MNRMNQTKTQSKTLTVGTEGAPPMFSWLKMSIGLMQAAGVQRERFANLGRPLGDELRQRSLHGVHGVFALLRCRGCDLALDVWRR